MVFFPFNPTKHNSDKSAYLIALTRIPWEESYEGVFQVSAYTEEERGGK